MSVTKQQEDHYITEAEYLEGEKFAEERHEYIDGRIYSMAGASKRHNRIAGNCYRAFMDNSGGQCEAFMGDLKVRASTQRKTYYYPDVVVGCAEDDNADEYYLEKPCLIVEVSSDSTIRKDYLEKALAYQTIPSLQAYLIVAQDKPLVDMLTRNAEGGWDLHQFDRLKDEISLPCLDMTLSLQTVYFGVNLNGHN
ncbi:Uma2 family endonuclease [Candidatus Thiothrix sp. Deng01]|uniref:Uma2 family endonuclease n=1 Tax=Candidatus Thiothrix phosphatis TaxID=3112415 RepID=A0ABU6CYI3_9GAMM|nr:Uma2 family endonuclease [Candidatus Thiothrix sp. Deng01]MEB4591153.1 Uma2 family endonuclease [Candidatus Thiothrix sp. Deng01]